MEDPSGLEPFREIPPAPTLPWQLDQCRQFGATYLIDGFDTFAEFFCG
jgi:hypothetical protein